MGCQRGREVGGDDRILGRGRHLCPARLCTEKDLCGGSGNLGPHRPGVRAPYSDGPATLDWPALLERKQGLIRDDPVAFEKGFIASGYDVIHGAAKFTGANELAVGDDPYSFKYILVATGSKARSLPIPGFEHTITSDDIMEMVELPESVVFIGGGVISL